MGFNSGFKGLINREGLTQVSPNKQIYLFKDKGNDIPYRHKSKNVAPMTWLVEYINKQQSLANRNRQDQGLMLNRWLRERRSLLNTSKINQDYWSTTFISIPVRISDLSLLIRLSPHPTTFHGATSPSGPGPLHDHNETHLARHDSSGRVMSPTHRTLPNNKQHKRQTSMSRRDSNPQSQHAGGRTPTPYRLRPYTKKYRAQNHF